MTTFRKSANANQPTLARRLVVRRDWGEAEGENVEGT